MHIHRTAHQRFFTTLGNEVLRDNRLSFCARGILGHLLSLPDGQRGDIRTLTERTPEGRERVASALRELERFGYLKRVVKRTPEGRVYTEVDVFDTPDGPSTQATPKTVSPGSGGLAATSDGDHPVNEQAGKPTLPQPTADEKPGREGDGDEETAASAQLLTRVARAEPKLALGVGEVLRLAPLVTEWRRRGASDLHIIGSLTAGLPSGGVYHPARFIETRLRNKMPAERRIAPARSECGECRVPVVVAGLCRACRQEERAGSGLSAEVVQVCARGVAMARAALRGLPVGGPVPGLA
jgi:hypothetical protein